MDENMRPPGDPGSLPPGMATPPPQLPPAAPPLLPPRLPAAPRSRRGWAVAAVVLAALLFFSLAFNFLSMFGRLVTGQTATRHRGPRIEELLVEDHNSANKVAVIEINGIISSDMLDAGSYSMVDFVRDQLDEAEEDNRVKAVILKVDSPGGEVMASDEISTLIGRFQNKTGKPVVASMGSVAASGGYYVSAPCRWIVANELTLTGSIGVIFHSFNYRGLLDKVGVRPVIYKSGKFKDMLSGDRREEDVSPEEREMMQALITQTYDKFKSVVSSGREEANSKNKGSKDEQGRILSSDWADYADGRVLSGSEAYRLGLVDELGNFEKAVKRAQKLARIDNANVVQYQQIYNLSDIFRLFGKSENSAKIKVDLGIEPSKLKAGRMYYLMPPLGE